MTSSPDVIVIGGGVLGLCSAAELAGRGHAVTVLDPGGPNASSVAAGMLAPALESLLEDVSPERAALLKRARDLWPDFAEAHGLKLHREGAEWRGPDPEAALSRLRGLGFEAQPIDGGLSTPEDWRIEAAPALAALARGTDVTVARARVAGLTGDSRHWRVQADDGRTWFSSSIVLATGAAAPPSGLPDRIAAAVAAIEPIRGQITAVEAAPPSRVMRAPGVYVSPTTGGVLIGATMEPGRRDLDPDPEEAGRQVAAGMALLGREGAVGQTRVGVRGASADGLPLAGPTPDAGLYLALAPRRNGWLMGPMVARVVADSIEGRAAIADAAALDPLRFV